jgi:hypothetical protein
MRIRRSFPILLGVLLVAAALTVIVQLRKHAPPEPARLLPGADGFLYVNLKWIRRANITGQLPPVTHDSEYARFLQATGFQFERDLDQAAFAIHFPEKRFRGSEPSRFSEIFVGRVDSGRLRTYLKQIATSIENYRSIDIYTIPLEGRTLRAALLGVDTVAASNHADPFVMRGIIDRSRKLASPFGGPALLRQYYKSVPIASLTWAILKVEPSKESSESSNSWLMSFLLNKPAVLVASARYLGSVHVRAEAFTAGEDDAKRVTDQLNTFLNVFHGAETNVSSQGTDKDVKQFFDSLKVEQDKNRAVLTANIPPGFIRKVMSEVPTGQLQPGRLPASSSPSREERGSTPQVRELP